MLLECGRLEGDEFHFPICIDQVQGRYDYFATAFGNEWKMINVK